MRVIRVVEDTELHQDVSGSVSNICASVVNMHMVSNGFMCFLQTNLKSVTMFCSNESWSLRKPQFLHFTSAASLTSALIWQISSVSSRSFAHDKVYLVYLCLKTWLRLDARQPRRRKGCDELLTTCVC